MDNNTAQREERILCGRISSAIKLAQEKYTTTFIGFLDSRCRSLAITQLSGNGFQNFIFNGGYEEADRVILAVYPEWEEVVFPISWIRIEGDGYRELSHRDYLGSLLSLGITRESVGDIITDSPHSCYAAVINKNKMDDFIVSNLSRVASNKVKVRIMPEEFSPEPNIQYERIQITVSSLRADGVLASLINTSRTKAAEFIAKDKFFVNSIIVNKNDYPINPGDVISIRGYGKFIFDGTDGHSRRDRIRAIFRKYK